MGAATTAWLWGQPLEDAVDRIAGLGFRHFEIMTAPPHVDLVGQDAPARRALRRRSERRGLTLTSLNPTFLDLNMVKVRLALVHLSDTDDTTWGHNPVGTGTIDFGAVSAMLNAIADRGVSILEVVMRQEPARHFRESLDRLRGHGWAP